jgi:hypothetical protein
MVKYECDSCQCVLDATEERYQVKVESKWIGPEEPLVMEETESDCVDEMTEHLEGDTVEIPMVIQPLKMNYDMCRGCFIRYSKNPLGLERKRAYTIRRN